MTQDGGSAIRADRNSIVYHKRPAALGLVRSFAASTQSLDQAVNDLAAARADVAEAEANHAAAHAGPTAEQLAIADAQVQAAAAALSVLERRLDKTVLRASADGVLRPPHSAV